jgi:hypothetical protein
VNDPENFPIENEVADLNSFVREGEVIQGVKTEEQDTQNCSDKPDRINTTKEVKVLCSLLKHSKAGAVSCELGFVFVIRKQPRSEKRTLMVILEADTAKGPWRLAESREE